MFYSNKQDDGSGWVTFLKKTFFFHGKITLLRQKKCPLMFVAIQQNGRFKMMFLLFMTRLFLQENSVAKSTTFKSLRYESIFYNENYDKM